jgi:hypothetical protein
MVGSLSAVPASWNDNEIVALVPDLPVGSATVTVSVASQASNSFPLVVLERPPRTCRPPDVYSISPSSGTVGSQVTIDGGCWGSYVPNNSKVTFSGIGGSKIAQVSYWDAGRIVVTVPPGATTGVVTVVGTMVIQLPFTVVTGQAISWPIPASITYGTALSAAQLNATIPVPGSCVYSPSAGTVLLPRQYVLTTTCTPTDTLLYGGPVSASTVLQVNKAPLTVRANDFTVIVGQAHPTFTATYNGFVNGDTPAVLVGAPSFSTTAPAGWPVGTYSITPYVDQCGRPPCPIGFSADNYTFVFVPGILSVTAGSPTITNLSLPQGPPRMGFVIYGSNFGAKQGESVVMIGTTPMTVVAWSDPQIVVQVSTAATSGNVIVTVNGVPSNGVNFAVVPPFSCP